MKKILIVDDEFVTRMDLKEILTIAGFDVIGDVSDGYKAIEFCKKQRPEIILMDINMPVIDGIKASKLIKDNDLADCIILLTAYCDKKFIDSAKNIGVDGYIVKPIDDKRLIPAIEITYNKYLEHKSVEKDKNEISLKLDERKIIDKAKGILMNKNNFSEDEAYKYLRKASMDGATKIVEVSKIIIAANED